MRNIHKAATALWRGKIFQKGENSHLSRRCLRYLSYWALPYGSFRLGSPVDMTGCCILWHITMLRKIPHPRHFDRWQQRNGNIHKVATASRSGEIFQKDGKNRFSSKSFSLLGCRSLWKREPGRRGGMAEAPLATTTLGK